MLLARILFYNALLIGACAYAWLRGRSDERIAATTCVVATVASFALLTELRFSRVEFGVLAVDLATLAVFVAVALRSERFWPLWVSGLQLTSLGTDAGDQEAGARYQLPQATQVVRARGAHHQPHPFAQARAAEPDALRLCGRRGGVELSDSHHSGRRDLARAPLSAASRQTRLATPPAAMWGEPQR